MKFQLTILSLLVPFMLTAKELKPGQVLANIWTLDSLTRPDISYNEGLKLSTLEFTRKFIALPKTNRIIFQDEIILNSSKLIDESKTFCVLYTLFDQSASEGFFRETRYYQVSKNPDAYYIKVGAKRVIESASEFRRQGGYTELGAYFAEVNPFGVALNFATSKGTSNPGSQFLMLKCFNPLSSNSPVKYSDFKNAMGDYAKITTVDLE